MTTEHAYPCAWDILCERAHMPSDYPAPTLALLRRRLSRFSAKPCSDDEIRAAHRAHFDREHRCAVLTDHTFSRPCALGVRHPGCCPNTHRRLINGHDRYYPLR